MKISSFISILPLLLIAIVPTPSAIAQTSEPACSIGVRNMVSYGNSHKLNAPFTAYVKTTFEQRLPDGNSVHGFIHTRQARDTAGKTYSESPMNCRLDENGIPQPELNVSVFDFETRISINWQTGPNALMLAHVRPPRDQSRETPKKQLSPEEIEARRKASQSQQPPRSEFKTEDLGTRTIAGVEVHGSRTTRTIPAGEEGNELPLVILNETWTSRDLNMILLAIDDDPRRGRSTYEVEDITRSEPDAALFAPPANYKVEETRPDIVAVGTSPK